MGVSCEDQGGTGDLNTVCESTLTGEVVESFAATIDGLEGVEDARVFEAWTDLSWGWEKTVQDCRRRLRSGRESQIAIPVRWLCFAWVVCCRFRNQARPHSGAASREEEALLFWDGTSAGLGTDHACIQHQPSYV
jgi:hypothetical protein